MVTLQMFSITIIHLLIKNMDVSLGKPVGIQINWLQQKPAYLVLH